jgi:choline dehydrogenase-like flavoprotein
MCSQFLELTILISSFWLTGTKNLRVVDASIMPIIPGANTQTTVYAVAERAADIIKEAYI